MNLTKNLDLVAFGAAMLLVVAPAANAAGADDIIELLTTAADQGADGSCDFWSASASAYNGAAPDAEAQASTTVEDHSESSSSPYKNGNRASASADGTGGSEAFASAGVSFFACSDQLPLRVD